MVLAGGFIFLIDVNGHITASKNATVSAFTNDYQNTSDRMASSSQEIADQNGKSGLPRDSQSFGKVQGSGLFKGGQFRVDAEPRSSKSLIHIQVNGKSVNSGKWPLDMNVAEIDYQGTSTDAEIKEAIKSSMTTDGDKDGATAYKSLSKSDIDSLVKNIKKAAAYDRSGTTYEMK